MHLNTVNTMNHPSSPMQHEHLMIISTLQTEISKLREQLARANGPRKRNVTLCVNNAGGVTLYGIGKYPISLYKRQWMRLIQHVNRIEEFIVVNNNLLKDTPRETLQQ